ncbi:Uncharacterised protein [Burkholderia pseudomallei]|nr:Uncharacterised protein [Burkholderia pseudomallei]CAJ8045422.1 Uncharacterised protein [Burkholderia pseudomallei]
MRSAANLTAALMTCMLFVVQQCFGDVPVAISGIYLDDGGNVPDVNELKTYGINEVHLFVNGNQLPSQCPTKSESFVYENGWTATLVDLTLDKFTKANLHVAITLSPRCITQAFIDSLSKPMGPMAILKKYQNADVELDLEGNWKESAKGPTGMNGEDAAVLLAKLVRKELPPPHRLLVTTNKLHMRDHAKFLMLADVISPQVYDDASLGPEEAEAALKQFSTAYPKKVIIAGLSIQCDAETQYLAGKCSEVNYQVAELLYASMQACNPVQYPGIFIWGSHELREVCVDKNDVCSYFGKKRLATNAANPPSTSCNRNLAHP